MRKMQRKLKKRDVFLIIIILILVIINLILFVKEYAKPKAQTQDNSGKVSSVKSEKEEVIVPKDDKELILKLSKMQERDRIEYYCGEYIKKLEQKDYESAYNLLYPEFKEKYFPTIDSYKEYINKTYPENFALEYDDITRQGNIYVLRLKILDVLGSREDEKVQRVVILENDYNNFVLSFQVI